MSAAYERIQEAQKTLKVQQADIRQALFNHFDVCVGEGTEAEIELGDGFRFTREARTTLRLDTQSLEKSLEPAAWKSITIVKREVDEDKLKDAMSKGKVSEDVVRENMIKSTVYSFNHRKIKSSEEEE